MGYLQRIISISPGPLLLLFGLTRFMANKSLKFTLILVSIGVVYMDIQIPDGLKVSMVKTGGVAET